MTAPILLAALAGCGRVPEAPSDLDELTHYLYREWDSEDPRVLEEGLSNLIDVLSGFDLDPETHVLDRSWELTSATAADIAGLELEHDRDPADTYGVGVAAESAWPVDDHGRWQVQPDQLPAEPSAAEYVRTYPELDDPACFVDDPEGCPILVTDNEIRRENLLMSVGFTLHKHFRHVELDDDRVGMIARSWVPHVAEGDGGNSTVWQSYSLDVWMPAGSGAWRYQVLWSEADVAGASDAIQIGTVKSSTDDHFAATDVAIEDAFH